MTTPPRLPRPLTAFRISLAAGLIVLALTIASILQGPAKSCGDLRAGYAPIVAFELARSQSDLDAIFGSAEGDCRTTMIAKMDATNWIDTFAFIPIYSLFLIFYTLGMRGRHLQLGNVGLVVALLAGASDYVENFCLLQITPALDTRTLWFALLPWATGVKWLALGGLSVVAALIYLRAQPINPIAGILCALAALVVVTAIVAPSSFGHLLSPAVGVSWLAFLLSSAVGSFQRTTTAA